MIANCANCNKAKSIKALRLCVTCYNYQQTTGVTRPARLYNRGSIFCRWCKRTKAFRNGLCRACFDYHARTGKKRPQRFYRKAFANCKNPNCKKPLWIDRGIKGLCGKCYNYQKKYDRERPLHVCRLMPDCTHPVICGNQNCDRPLRRASRKRRKGYCTPCYDWQLQYGSDRPYDLCYRKIDIGWCDCGNVAIKAVEVQNGSGVITLALCLDCYELETQGLAHQKRLPRQEALSGSQSTTSNIQPPPSSA